jgi:hypothetical protein
MTAGPLCRPASWWTLRRRPRLRVRAAEQRAATAARLRRVVLRVGAPPPGLALIRARIVAEGLEPLLTAGTSSVRLRVARGWARAAPSRARSDHGDRAGARSRRPADSGAGTRGLAPLRERRPVVAGPPAAARRTSGRWPSPRLPKYRSRGRCHMRPSHGLTRGNRAEGSVRSSVTGGAGCVRAGRADRPGRCPSLRQWTAPWHLANSS